MDWLIPRYVYGTESKISVAMEIYRWELMNEIIQLLAGKISEIDKNKLQVYMSQFIMNTLAEKTTVSNNNNANRASADPFINLDDGLFNIPSDIQIKQFYDDINSTFRGAKNQIFHPDELGIKDKIIEIIDKLQKFKDHEVVCSVDSSGQFKIENIDKKLANELSLKPYLIAKCKKFYNGPPEKFYEIVLCCHIRYLTLGSGGHQYVVDLVYKKQLKDSFGVNFECFASVFNRYFDNFCSMFYDIEKYFGSCGSFFALRINSGFFMATPPYAEKLLEAMYSHIKSLIKTTTNITFLTSIPEWKNFTLNDKIENDKLYLARKVKHEHYHNPYALEQMPLIPPYIDFIFTNVAVDPKLIELFNTYTNGSTKKLLIRPENIDLI
jgi:hypothetical protein